MSTVETVPSIEVVPGKKDIYRVTVVDRASTTVHEVTVADEEASRLAPEVAPMLLLYSSFEFLLEREPKESILRRFPISAITSYFSEYPRQIRGRSLEAAERFAASVFTNEGIEYHSWSNEPGFEYPAHEHSYDKVLFCVAGSITVETGSGRSRLMPGSRLDLPAHSSHSAVVGSSGVTCLEGRR